MWTIWAKRCPKCNKSPNLVTLRLQPDTNDSYLNSDFRQVDLHCQLFPAVHVRVVRLLEGAL